MTVPDMCACGRPLHYLNPDTREMVERIVARYGPLINVKVQSLGTWKVPRHYIALHGLKAQALPQLALHLGFKRIK